MDLVKNQSSLRGRLAAAAALLALGIFCIMPRIVLRELPSPGDLFHVVRASASGSGRPALPGHRQPALPPAPAFCSTARRRAKRKGGRRGGKIAAIYSRHSTRFQHSVDDQVRECRDWAEKNGYEVPDELVFIDRAKSGRLRRRPGRLALQEAIENNAFDVLVVLTTSRLERNNYRLQQFVQEEIVERDLRCVFVKSGIDTMNDAWEMTLNIHGMLDSQQARSNRASIQAGQSGLFLQMHVHGTVTFGYRGVDVPGAFTKAGKPRQRYAVDPETSAWVKQAYDWFVVDRLSMNAIVRRLNDQQAPLPPRCATGRWTPLAVKKLLTNPRYRADWSYGRTEARLLNGKDYVRQTARETPLQSAQFEDLRIVDDATWHKAQSLRENNPHVAGRRSHDGDTRSRPKLLNGILHCGYHDRALVTGGGRGKKWICPICKETGGELYSLLDRELATAMVCEKLADLLAQDNDLVERVVGFCREVAEDVQRPDEGKLEDLRRKVRQLTDNIGRAQRSHVATEQDERENQQLVRELRQERSGLQAELAYLEEAAGKEVTVPTADEVRSMLANTASILVEAVDAGEDELGKARRIVEQLTGGRILAFQSGPAERQKGWLKGAFTPAVVRYIAGEFGVNVEEPTDAVVEIEFRRPPVHERIADEAKQLWDDGLTYVEIAKRIGWNRNLVAKAIGYWHQSRGLPAPDGRSCVGRLKAEPTLAERIADPVMHMIARDRSMKEIAEHFKTSRKHIRQAIVFWHESRGLPVPDGRALRKQRNARRRKSQKSQDVDAA